MNSSEETIMTDYKFHIQALALFVCVASSILENLYRSDIGLSMYSEAFSVNFEKVQSSVLEKKQLNRGVQKLLDEINNIIQGSKQCLQNKASVQCNEVNSYIELLAFSSEISNNILQKVVYDLPLEDS